MPERRPETPEYGNIGDRNGNIRESIGNIGNDNGNTSRLSPMKAIVTRVGYHQ